MGRLFSQKGDIKKAEEWFDYALKLEPTNARVRIARAAWLLDQGRAADARTETDEALKLDPKSTEARRLKGSSPGTSATSPRPKRSSSPCTATRPLMSPSPTCWRSAWSSRTIRPSGRAGLKLAEVDARQCPRSHEVLATLGWAQYRAGQLDQAEQILRTAVQGVRTTPGYRLLPGPRPGRQGADR